MKIKNLIKFVLSITLLTFTSCQKKDLQSSEEVNSNTIQLSDNLKVIEKDGKYYLADDILITLKQLKILKENQAIPRSVFTSKLVELWPNGTIPYTIHSNFINTQRITDAVSMIHAQTPVQLVPRTSQTDQSSVRMLDIV